MRLCIIWLICLQFCASEYVDYSDYHPENIPVQNINNLQYDSPSPEYKSVMANLCDNWQSPISYLKKRGYMPKDKPIARLKKQDDDTYRKKMLLKGKNYFFFPENEQQSLKDNSIALDEDGEYNSGGTNTTPPVREPSDEPKNDTTGIIDKVRQKIFSLFSPKAHDKESVSKSETLDRNYDTDDTEFSDNSNDYKLSDRRLFVRSTPEKPANLSRTEGADIFSNLSETDVQYVKSFINCFKKSKQDFQIQPTSSTKSITSTTTAKTDTDSKPYEAKQNEIKPGVAKPIANKPTVGTSTEGNTTPKAVTSTTAECMNVDITEAAATPKSSTQQGGSKGTADDLTVDLDINQKNGTGEESHPPQGCQFVPILSTACPLPSDAKQNKYIIKSKFLAHLHHMVDEVGKPLYKPLDLRKVQAVIDQSKNLPTVTMGDGKTTECAPLRLNDMSFDLEWNRIEKSPDKTREKLNFLNFPYLSQPQGQGLAAKFLQDVNSYPANADEPLKAPYSDNFLDSQRSLPDVEIPLKISTKREAFAPSSASHSHKFSKLLSDIASLPDPGDDKTAYYMDDDSADSSKRRVKGRLKSRGRKKPKAKFRGGSPSKSPSNTADVDITPLDFDDFDQTKENDFNSFEELKDIQFRVNDDDEEAISKFIANLNSPPEVFSFDVDKYLRSAKQDMEPPQAPEFEYQSPEPRTYYEFMDAPAVEKERIPLGDTLPPADLAQEDAILRKCARPSGGKRDLLRQYIKGVSSALNHDFPELSIECNRANEEKSQRSPNLNTDLLFRTNSLVDGFSTSLDAMNYIKSNDNGDFLDNYFLLNDGSSTINDLDKQEVIPDGRYSPQSLELDLDLNKKFRGLDVGALSGGNRMQQDSAPIDAKSVNDPDEVNSNMDRRDFETTNEQI